MSPENGAKLCGAAILLSVIGGVWAIIDPPRPPPPEKHTASTDQSDQPIPKQEKQWVNYVGSYYVSCKITDGIRWYTAINRNDLTDAQ